MSTLYDFMLGPHNDHKGDEPWFIDAISKLTYTQRLVKQRTDALALGLHTAFKFKQGDGQSPPGIRDSSVLGPVVSLFSPNDVDYATCIWACHKLGCTIAPSHSGSTVSELIHQLRLTGAGTIIAHISVLGVALEAAAAVDIPMDRVIVLTRGTVAETHPSLVIIDVLIARGILLLGRGQTVSRPPSPSQVIAFLCFSSGTTGLPKGVAISHSAVITAVLQMSVTDVPAAHVTPNSKALGVLPISHMWGLFCLPHLCPHLGIASVLFPKMPAFGEFLDILEEMRVDHLFLAPPLVNAFLNHKAAKGRDFSYFKTGLVAAAPLGADRERKFVQRCGPDFVFAQVFGMTELSGPITCLPLGRSPTVGSVGVPLSETEAKVIDTSGKTLAPGMRGELCLRGPQMFLGYLNNKEATAAALDSDGFLLTGDEVIMDENGDIFILDRIKHLIKHKGYQVSPAELEAALLDHPCVEDAGVVGEPDERSGEVPVAFVVLTAVGQAQARKDPEVMKQSIEDHIRVTMSEYKWLKDVFFIDAIPKLPSGKILSRELKKLLDEMHPADAWVPAALQRQDSSMLVSVASLFRSASQKKDPEKSLPSEKGDQITLIPSHDSAAKDAREKRAEKAPTSIERVREWFSLYRLMFIAVFSVNLVGMIFTLAHKWDKGREFVATFALCNIMAALLARNEVFLRGLYGLLLFLFQRWPPYQFRHAIASFLLHFGGLHLGFAVSGTLWFIVATAEFFREGPKVTNPAILAFSIIACTFLFTICCSAYPTLRQSHHNVFGNTHWLVGWSGLGILWVLVGLADSWSTTNQTFSGKRLASKPDIYLAIALTFCIALPWITLEKVPVKSEVLSSSVILLRFEGSYRSGLFGRISRHPLKENHAFGITSISRNSNEHYMYIVGQGDFTRDLIADPPTYLWTRSFKFVGLPMMTSFFRSGLYVVTGSAIGVGLSIFLQRDPKSRWLLLWVSRNIQQTYGSTVLRDLKESFNGDEDLYEQTITLWDSRIKGRPNLLQLTHDIVKRNDLEVVFVTSNPQGTADMVRGCGKMGIPCLGPIWDS